MVCNCEQIYAHARPSRAINARTESVDSTQASRCRIVFCLLMLCVRVLSISGKSRGTRLSRVHTGFLSPRVFAFELECLCI